MPYKLLDHASEATGSHCGSNDVEGISHHALFSRKTTRFQDLCISLLSRQSRQLKCWDYNRQSRNSSALLGKALHIIQLHLLQIPSNSSFHVFSGVWDSPLGYTGIPHKNQKHAFCEWGMNGRTNHWILWGSSFLRRFSQTFCIVGEARSSRIGSLRPKLATVDILSHTNCRGKF